MSLQQVAETATRIAAVVGVVLVLGSIFVFIAVDSVTIRNYIQERSGVVEVRGEVNERLGSIETQLTTQIQTFTSDLERLRQSLDTSTATINATVTTLNALVEDHRELTQNMTSNREPCVRFEFGGHEATDATIGGFTRVTVRMRKLRECGFAEHGVWIRNGATQYHACKDISMADPRTGRMVTLAPQTNEVHSLVFTCRIPWDQGIAPGRAFLWLMPFYEGAPMARHDPSPEIPFLISSASPDFDPNNTPPAVPQGSDATQ